MIMGNNIEKFEIEGLQEVMDAIQDLPAELQRKIIRGVLTKAGRKFIVNELRSALPYSSRLKESLSVVNDRNDKNAVFAGVSVGKRVDNKLPAGILIRFLDGGTVERKTKKGYNRGSITAKNEVPSVIESNIQPLIDYINTEFGNEVCANLERRIKRAKKING